tara:strand:+ start:1156 stop:2784 length:1629 start_codon:yes stop_codon:yes gene_type:complete
MTQVASTKTVAIPLDGVTFTIGSNQYQFSAKGNEIWVEFDDPDARGKGRNPSRINRQILMTTGSHHFQVYWYAASDFDRSLRMLDAAYVIDTDRWMYIGSVFLKPPDRMPEVSGLWNASCILCHSTRGNPKMIPEKGFDSQAVEFGIACESCHGPGAEHIKARQFPVSRYALHWEDGPDTTIVNPKHLDPVREALVCGQCHAVFDPKSGADFKTWKMNGSSFQPGDEELPLREISFEGDQYFWSDGLVRVTGREYNDLMVSPCFTHGDAERGIMTCLSCHSMHQDHNDLRPVKTWADRQLQTGMDGPLACVQCHTEFGDSETLLEHTHHPLETAASECVNCHMPHTTWGQQRAIRSHAITSPNIATAVATGRPDACNLCHLDKTYDWTAKYLNDWYQQPLLSIPDDEREVAVGPLLAIRGNAGQRALMAWAFGWTEARATTGTWWMPPYLALMMQDSYDVIRYRAHRSLMTIPGYESLAYEFDGRQSDRTLALRNLQKIWGQNLAVRSDDVDELLIRSGTVDGRISNELLSRRDNRVFYLQE